MVNRVTDISASTGRNDFIFDIWLWHGDLYRVSPFQVYCTSTSCLLRDLEFFMFAVMKTFVTDISANIKSFLPVEAEISVTKIFIMANMKNSKSHGKQEVDVQ
jgi:hypothetical protein